MMRRNELYPPMIDRGWPHQIRLPEEAYAGKAYNVVHGFCEDERLSVCPRGHSVSRDAQWFHIFCFAERAHAERFKERFGGEWFDRKAWNDEERAGCMARRGLHKVRGRWVAISKSTND
ncbi:hypothetical protein [Labrys sp. WJW]|uniref:hypothetical protein n=1 Tax=Labrys sp. WJW TaxID=1737983 RepID=UPI0012EA1BCD|nr:hypothetical protein [Labrys sp. WJW]